MEVHAHSHTARKKWTHYFWEFIMLFLAVFCGFLAEYQLEHKIEKERGKQYIRSFYEDLITDSSHFNELISTYMRKRDVLQNITPCYDSLLSDHPPKNCFRNILMNSFDFPDLVYTDRTLQQLKNAGGLRLLKAADADSILLYDNQLRKYKVAETSGFQEIQSEIRNSSYSLYNFKKGGNTSQANQEPVLFGDNRELLNRYFNQLTTYSLWCGARLRDLQKLKKRNTDLIAFFKTRYRFN